MSVAELRSAARAKLASPSQETTDTQERAKLEKMGVEDLVDKARTADEVSAATILQALAREAPGAAEGTAD